MDANVPLKPCPFCGNSNIDPAGWTSDDGREGPTCDECGASAESAEGWNRRAQLSRLTEPSEEVLVAMVRVFREAMREPRDLPIEGRHGWTPEYRNRQIAAMRAALASITAAPREDHGAE